MGGYATYSVSQNDNSDGLSGTALERNNLSWNLMQSYNSHDDEVGGNMSLTYDGSYGTVNGYNYSQNSQRLNWYQRGLHSEGVTLSQELGELRAAGLEIDNMRGCCDGLARLYGQDIVLNPYDEKSGSNQR